MRFYRTFSTKRSRGAKSDVSLCLSQVHITQYADSVASHLAKILDSDKHSDVISSAKYVATKPPSEKNKDGREK